MEQPIRADVQLSIDFAYVEVIGECDSFFIS